MTAVHVQATEDVSRFLEDVIGKGQVLTPSSGKLRQIHARIGKEVTDAKSQLHSTVQKEWPTLEKQLKTTSDLSARLKRIQGDVAGLETELDGNDTSLRPRLHKALTAHAEVSRRHDTAATLLDLLQSLQGCQVALSEVQRLLEDVRLEGAVPAVQAAERALASVDGWKRDSALYRSMKSSCASLRSLLRERLTNAFDAALAFDKNNAQFTISTQVLAEPTSAGRHISLASVLRALAQIEPLERLFNELAKMLLGQIVEVLLTHPEQALVLASQDAEKHTLRLQTTTTSSSTSTLQSLTVLLNALRTYFLPDSTPAAISHLFWAFLIPAVQQFIKSHLLEAALPPSADPAQLTSFSSLCAQVADFETTQLVRGGSDVEPVLREWTDNAGMHWSRKIIESALDQLRSQIASNAYWDQTETVMWDEGQIEAEDKAWTAMLEWKTEEQQSSPITKPRPTPDSGSNDLWHIANGSNPVRSPTAAALAPPFAPSESSSRKPSFASAIDELDVEPAEDAWGFDEDGQEVLRSPVASSSATMEPGRTPKLGARNIIEASPAIGADDAWGFEEEEAAVAGDEAVPEMNGSNAIEADADAMQKSETAAPDSKDDDMEDAGGWSFDEDAELPAEAEPVPTDPPEPSSAATGIPQIRKAMDAGEREAGWEAWNKVEAPRLSDEEERPIGKPAKVVKSKRLGGVRRGSPAPEQAVRSPSPSVSSEQQAIVPESRPVPAIQHPAPLPSVEPQDTLAAPATPILVEQYLVSSRSKAVLKLSDDILSASLAVSSPQYTSTPFAPAAARLSRGFSELLSLYRALMPVAHASLLETVPSIGMQFANDCVHIASEAARESKRRLASSVTHTSGKEEVERTRQALLVLRRYGEKTLEDQVDMQRIPLMEALDDTDGLRNTDDPKAFQQCERSVRQVIATLNRIAQAWRPVMRRSVYLDSLGILVNAVLFRVLVEIENQEDISEEASHRLNDLCKMLHTVEDLFPATSTGMAEEGGESSVALHVRIWFKFKFLSELLEASMADIMFLYTDGHLVDFSATELSKLIRALFSDSPLRQKNLDTIARGGR